MESFDGSVFIFFLFCFVCKDDYSEKDLPVSLRKYEKFLCGLRVWELLFIDIYHFKITDLSFQAQSSAANM